MEDYIKRHIDMIGRMLLLLAEKLHLLDGDASSVPLQVIQDEIEQKGGGIDVGKILDKEHPVAFMVEELLFSDEALERFVEIVMHTDADPVSKQRVLNDAVAYLDGKGKYSFSLHSFLN